jgi:hypothetical protein
MTSTQWVLDGDGLAGGVLFAGLLGVSLGAGSDGALLGVVDGAVPEVGRAVALSLGWAEDFVDGFLLGVVPADAPGFAAPPGLVAPPAGWVARAVPVAELGNVIRPTVGMPVAGVVPGCWFAAGVPVNTLETSTATSPALPRTPAPSAMAVALRRCGGFG